MSATFVYLSNVIMESDSPFLLSSLDIPSATDVSFSDRAFMYVDNSEIKSVLLFVLLSIDVSPILRRYLA